MPPPMSKRLSLLALALGLLAAACSTPTQATVEFGSGTQFVPEVADSLNDAGLFPSVVTTDDGQPYVAYFSFPDKLPEGSVAPPRPIGLPSIPGVMLATVKDGIWTRGAIAIAASIPNVSVAFGPATDASVGKLSHQNVTGLQLVADAQGGLHAAWGSSGGLYYASGTGDPSGTPWTMERVTEASTLGLSLTLDDSGAPWIAYYGSGTNGPSVEVAHLDGSNWVIEGVAPASSCSGCSTAIGVTRGSPAVAFSDGGSGVSVATPSPNTGGPAAAASWSTTSVDTAGGQGLAMAIDGSGAVWLSYYASSQVKVATGSPGSLRGTSAVTVGANAAAAVGARTSIDVDDHGTYALGWTDATGDTTTIGFGTGTAGKAATPIATGDTTDGSYPSVAVTPDGATSFLSWYLGATGAEAGGIVPGEDLLLGTYGDVQGLALAVQSPTPTGGAPSASPTPSSTCEQADKSDTVQVVAQGIAFTPDTSCIEVPAGTPFTIHFDNKDAATQHNIAIFPSANDLTTVLFRGDLVTGPDQADYSVDALDTGDYFFHCDVHPTMTGQVVVK
jgi:plastocyanin